MNTNTPRKTKPAGQAAGFRYFSDDRGPYPALRIVAVRGLFAKEIDA